MDPTGAQPVAMSTIDSQPAIDELDMETEPSLVTSIFYDQVSQTKLLASLILFVITLLCGYLPVRVLLNQNYIQYAMFAGGGVLMATAFCHLIPEAHDNYKTLGLQQHHHLNQPQLHHHHHHHQPNHLEIDHNHDHLTASNLSQLIANSSSSSSSTNATTAHIHSTSGSFNVPYLEMTLCCGFFFMYLVEQLMAKLIKRHGPAEPFDTSMGQLVVGVAGGGGGDTGAGHYNSHLSHCHQQQVVEAEHCHCHSTSVGNAVVSSNSAASNLSVGANSSGSNQRVHLSPSSGYSELYKFIRGFLIVSAFMAHSIFDGVAIGSQETVEKVWTIFLAISCHKLIIAAVVGLELYVATLESHLWTLVHLSIFSIMSPIGIILVVLAQSSLHIDSNHPAMILLQSFATGTLLYIVFVEILQPKENQGYEKNRFGKSVSLIAGFGLMLLVLTLIDE